MVTPEVEELIHLRQRVQEADLEKYQNLLKDFLGEIKAMMAESGKIAFAGNACRSSVGHNSAASIFKLCLGKRHRVHRTSILPLRVPLQPYEILL
ncbi:MAG: hypothetical protein JSR33_12630 [Proteobacteria bacterium]|nr:hypothetical protein [Pseudomonadota bacterium]